MPTVKPLSEMAEKWNRRAAAAAQDYKAGIERPRADWAAQAAAAAAAFVAGIQAAIAANAFTSGIAKAGTAKWKHRALVLGVPRFAQGILASADNYARGVAPFREEIERTSLPPRGARGDPSNLERVRVIATALHDLKIRLRGSP